MLRRHYQFEFIFLDPPSVSVFGNLQLISALDFENPTDANGDNIYEFTVVASDGVNETTELVSFELQDVQESASPPAFTSPDQISVDEGENAVVTLAATDPDGDNVTFSITGGDDDIFLAIRGVDNNELTFGFPPEFSAPSDANNDNVYEVEVTADDGSGNAVIQLLSITINDVNFSPDLFASTGYTEENTFATDVVIEGYDFRDNDLLTVTLSGDDAAFFSIVSTYDGPGNFNSTIVFNNAPDFEMPLDANGDNIYDVTIELSDGVNTVTQAIDVLVDDVEDVGLAPEFVSPSAVSVNEGETLALVLEAQDPEGDAVTFELTTGFDSSFFSIEGVDNNELTFDFAPEFSAPNDGGHDNVYEVEVIASDGFNEVAQSFFITVTDVNTAPTLTTNSGFSMENYIFTGAFVSADDFEDMNDTLTITLTGDDGALFTFATILELPGSIGGDIEFTVAPDFETPLDANGDNIYEITVELTDGVNTVTQDITITVEDDDMEVGTAKASQDTDQDSLGLNGENEANETLASFSVEDDGIINLTDDSDVGLINAPTEIFDVTAETMNLTSDLEEQIIFEEDAAALEMQFAADLLMLQDSTMIADG